MSGSYQGGRPLAGTGNAAADVTRFFAQMTLLPFSTFIYSMEVFLEGMKAMQRAADQSIDATAGGAAHTPGGASGGVGGFFDSVISRTTGGGAGSTRQATREEERTMSDQSWNRDQDSGRREVYQDSGRRDQSYYQDSGRRDQGYDSREYGRDCKESDPCDRLRLVRYKILFLKRGLEVAFPEQEELVDENIDRDGFMTWKIAEFIQKLHKTEAPDKWCQENYPRDYSKDRERKGPQRERGKNPYIYALPDADKKYLRVYCQVLYWYDREKRNYERDQADYLKDIAEAINRCLCPPDLQQPPGAGQGSWVFAPVWRPDTGGCEPGGGEGETRGEATAGGGPEYSET
jgi:hypothetical protein